MQNLHRLEVNIRTYHFGVHKTICVSSSRVMIRVHPRLRHGVGPFLYCVSWWDLSNGFLKNINGDCMQRLLPKEVYVPTFHLWVHKTIGISSTMAMLRVYYSWRHGVWPFYYYIHMWDLSNGLWSDLNKHLIQRLCHQEVDVQTYHNGFHKIGGVSSSRYMFRVNYRLSHGISPFHYSTTWWDLSNSLSINLNKYRMQNIFPRKDDIITYHLGVHKQNGVSSYRVILKVHYILMKGVILFTIYLLCDTFPKVSLATQIEIVWKIILP